MAGEREGRERERDREGERREMRERRERGRERLREREERETQRGSARRRPIITQQAQSWNNRQSRHGARWLVIDYVVRQRTS